MSMPFTGSSSLICWKPISASPLRDHFAHRGAFNLSAFRFDSGGDAELREQLRFQIHAAGAIGIGDRFGGQQRPLQRVYRADIGFPRARLDRDADAGVGPDRHGCPALTLPCCSRSSSASATMITTSMDSPRSRRMGMASCVVPMEAPNSLISLLWVARSYCGASSLYAAVNAPEVTTVRSGRRARDTENGRGRSSSAARSPARRSFTWPHYTGRLSIYTWKCSGRIIGWLTGGVSIRLKRTSITSSPHWNGTTVHSMTPAERVL